MKIYLDLDQELIDRIEQFQESKRFLKTRNAAMVYLLEQGLFSNLIK